MRRPDLCLLVALVALAGGCAHPPAGDEAAETQRYTVAGEIVRLPEAGRPDGSDIYIRHEAIPSFVDAQGETVGMEAMTMGFPLGKGVDLTGLAVGDPIEFDLEIRWHGSPPVQISRLVKATAAAPPEPADAPSEPTDDTASADHAGDHSSH